MTSTNRDVDALNAELRQMRRDRGELVGQDVQLDTKHGAVAFAVGDRVQFTDTDKKLRIYNGNVGTITRLNPATGEITARLDATGRDGREVRWSAAGAAKTWSDYAASGMTRHDFRRSSRTAALTTATR
jgi:ATP-dependent exoDNAse (exonuclease V) alpha subunit